jgi:hypothetical protein
MRKRKEDQGHTVETGVELCIIVLPRLYRLCDLDLDFRFIFRIFVLRLYRLCDLDLDLLFILENQDPGHTIQTGVV